MIGVALYASSHDTERYDSAKLEPTFVCTQWEEHMKWFVCPRGTVIYFFDGGFDSSNDCIVTLEENARMEGNCVRDMRDEQEICGDLTIVKRMRRDCEKWESIYTATFSSQL